MPSLKGLIGSIAFRELRKSVMKFYPFLIRHDSVEEGEDVEGNRCMMVRSHFSGITLEDLSTYLKEKQEILPISVFYFIFFFSNSFRFGDLTTKIDNPEDIC
jgi:hypothetical protein